MARKIKHVSFFVHIHKTICKEKQNNTMKLSISEKPLSKENEDKIETNLIVCVLIIN